MDRIVFAYTHTHARTHTSFIHMYKLIVTNFRSLSTASLCFTVWIFGMEELWYAHKCVLHASRCVCHVIDHFRTKWFLLHFIHCLFTQTAGQKHMDTHTHTQHAHKNDFHVFMYSSSSHTLEYFKWQANKSEIIIHYVFSHSHSFSCIPSWTLSTPSPIPCSLQCLIWILIWPIWCGILILLMQEINVTKQFYARRIDLNIDRLKHKQIMFLQILFIVNWT